MANKNEPPAAPPIVRPQNWGDNKPMATDMKKSILRDVQKIVVVGNVTKS